MNDQIFHSSCCSSFFPGTQELISKFRKRISANTNSESQRTGGNSFCVSAYTGFHHLCFEQRRANICANTQGPATSGFGHYTHIPTDAQLLLYIPYPYTHALQVYNITSSLVALFCAYSRLGTAILLVLDYF